MSPRFSLRVLAAQSDERLAELVRQGHEVAFEALAKRYRRRLLRYCRRLGLGDAGAEDVVQQALLQAWLALAAGQEVRHIRAWLFRIAHNAASNARRRIAAWQVCLSDPGDARSALALEMDLERVVAARSALGEVAALPAMQREAIVLTALEGKTHQEAAGALGVSSAAVRGLVYRARESLRSAAAALIPQPFLAWVGSGADGGASMVQRLAQLTGNGGAGQSLTALVLKGGAAAFTAGALAASSGVVQLNPAGPSRASHSAHTAATGDIASSGRRATRGADATATPFERASGQRGRGDGGVSGPGRGDQRGRGQRPASALRVRGWLPATGEHSSSSHAGGPGPEVSGRGGPGPAASRPTSSANSGPSSGGSVSGTDGGPGHGDGSSAEGTASSSGPGPSGSGSEGPSSSSGGSDDGRSPPSESPLALSAGGGSSSDGGSYSLSG